MLTYVHVLFCVNFNDRSALNFGANFQQLCAYKLCKCVFSCMSVGFGHLLMFG